VEAQRTFESYLNETGDGEALLALADFWMTAGCPKSARHYLLELAESDLKPALCLRIARSYAAEQDLQNAKAWWMRAYTLLSEKRPMPGKPLLNWLGAFRTAYGASVFSELEIPKADARGLLRLARLYSDGELLRFQHTARELEDSAGGQHRLDYNFGKLLKESGERLSSFGGNSSTTDHVLALFRSRAGKVKTRTTDENGLHLHFSMNLKIGGTERHMMRSLLSQHHPGRHVVITCEKEVQPDYPILQTMAVEGGIEVYTAMEFKEADPQWPPLLGPAADGPWPKESLDQYLDPGMIASCIGALKHFSPQRVTVWGLYIYEYAAFAAYLSDVPEVELRVGSLPLQVSPAATIHARSANLFLARACALFMGEQRFRMSLNARAIWRDFQRKVPMAFAEDRVFVHHNPFPNDLVQSTPRLSPAALKAQLGVPEAHLVLGHVTRIDPNKNLVLLLEAAAELARAMQNVSFVIVGDGPSGDFVSGLARRLGITDRCHFVGRQVSSLKSYYQLMDAVLLTTDCEGGLSNTLLEAQALGIPVVARASGGVIEAVNHGVTGLVVHSRKPRDLAEAVERVFRDPSFRKQVHTRGPAFIRALTDAPARPLRSSTGV
jgi:glycosyltransferase involved in cell wall biosynthesis